MLEIGHFECAVSEEMEDSEKEDFDEARCKWNLA